METQVLNPVEILTVKAKIPLFKGEEQATAIELIQLNEVGFEIVAQKDLYSINEKVAYIQPDYSLSTIELFDSYLAPNGDPNKTRLGSNNRVRAIKFTLHRGDGQPVYSQGILLPMREVISWAARNGVKRLDNLTEVLQITKWEAPEEAASGGLKNGKSKPFPTGVYKTDETNINTMWGVLENKITYPILLIGTEKIDGSSITIGKVNGKGFICSRNLEKPLTLNKVVSRRSKTLIEKLLFWTKPDLNKYEEVPNDDDFVKYGREYLRIIENQVTNTDFIFRGELSGGGMKGSGNKHNPAAKEPVNIKFFGMDWWDNGKAVKASFHEFQHKAKMLYFPTVDVAFAKIFYSKEEIVAACEDYFKRNKIEGIVIRTQDSTFSAKYMNLEYDAKK